MKSLLFFPYMAKTTENLPNRIREWRQRREMTLVDLAKAVGTTQTHMSRLELGDRPLTLEWMERIARALGIHVGDLLRADHNPDLPTERERRLLAALRDGGEQAMRTVEAVAEAQRPFTPQRSDDGAPGGASGGPGGGAAAA